MKFVRLENKTWVVYDLNNLMGAFYESKNIPRTTILIDDNVLRLRNDKSLYKFLHTRSNLVWDTTSEENLSERAK